VEPIRHHHHHHHHHQYREVNRLWYLHSAASALHVTGRGVHFLQCMTTCCSGAHQLVDPLPPIQACNFLVLTAEHGTKMALSPSTWPAPTTQDQVLVCYQPMELRRGGGHMLATHTRSDWPSSSRSRRAICW
jgi:hypothetical protein